MGPRSADTCYSIILKPIRSGLRKSLSEAAEQSQHPLMNHLTNDFMIKIIEVMSKKKSSTLEQIQAPNSSLLMISYS